jgi:hypothetical protein
MHTIAGSFGFKIGIKRPREHTDAFWRDMLQGRKELGGGAARGKDKRGAPEGTLPYARERLPNLDAVRTHDGLHSRG